MSFNGLLLLFSLFIADLSTESPEAYYVRFIKLSDSAAGVSIAGVEVFFLSNASVFAMAFW